MPTLRRWSSRWMEVSMETPNPRGISNGWSSAAEAAGLHGRIKGRKPSWSFDQSKAPKFEPKAQVIGKSEASLGERGDGDRRVRLSDWSPCKRSSGFRVAKNERDSATATSLQQEKKRLANITIVDDAGEEKEIANYLRTNTLHVTHYGHTFYFRKTNKSKLTVEDGRTGKRITLQNAFAELCRMLGATNGEAAYRQLCS